MKMEQEQIVKYFVTIAGNIGVGKSTLTDLLAAKLGWEAYFEPFEENPFLDDFYQDMKRWGFHSQIFFLSKRLQQHYALLQRTVSVVQDRSVYEDAEIFARNLFKQGYITDREWITYLQLYQTFSQLVKPPSLVVYLRASIPTLLRRIPQRGRDYEVAISKDYLTQLNELYEEWILYFKLCPILTIETDNLDYVQSHVHLDIIVQRIKERLHGKDVLTFVV
jgi:deoxyadenosine/deoxycytidine kinase